MAYTSARATLGGSDVRKTTKQTKKSPAPSTTVSAVTGGRGVRRVARQVSTPSAPTTSPASVSSSGNRARSAPSPVASRRQAEQQRARRLRRVVKEIQQPTRAPKPVEKRVQAELTERVKGRAAERISKLKVRVVPKLSEPVKVTKRQIKVSPQTALKAAQKPPQTPQQAQQRQQPGQRVKRVKAKLQKAAKKTTRVNAPSVIRQVSGLGPDAAQLAKLSIKEGRKHGIPPSVLFNQQGIESGWGANLGPSSAGAMGHTQFMPATRAAVKAEHGVDAYAGAKEAVKAQATHLDKDLGYRQDPAGAIYGYNHADWYVEDVLEGAKQYEALDKVDPQRLKAKPKPIPKPLRRKAQDVLGPRRTRKVIEKAKRAPAVGPTKRPGPWMGTKEATLSVLPTKAARAQGRGDKRTPEENASVDGAENSDHLTTKTNAYAADIDPDPKVYNQIQRKLGLPITQTGEQSIVKDGYRYQLIFGAEYGHGDHIHLGAEWVGEGVPPGTVAGAVGGAVGGITTGGTTTAPSGAAPSAQSVSGATAAQATGKVRKRRKKRAQEDKMAKALSLIRQGLPAELPGYEVPTTRESYAEFAKKRPVEVGL